MQSESEKSFENILEDNKHKIYRICQIYSVAPIEPQDLFQEIIFQIWKSLDSFKGKSSINTWIYKIAINICLRSKTKYDKSNNITDRFDSIHFTPVEGGLSTSELEKYQHLRECITSLNESDKSFVVLYLDDLQYREIALITGLSENHIAVKMRRIRKKLFECIMPKIK